MKKSFCNAIFKFYIYHGHFLYLNLYCFLFFGRYKPKQSFLELHSTTQTPTTLTHTHPYEHTYANSTPMSTYEDVHNTYAHSSLWTHVCKPYPYEHLRRIEPTYLEINEVTTDVSLLMGTSPTTESIASLNSKINLRKCEHPCQVDDLNPDEQVPPQET